MAQRLLTVRKYPLRKTAKKVVVHRSYKLKLYGNKAKTDTARYTQVRFNQYCNMFLGRVFFGEQKISTKGLGDLANKALYRSKNAIASLKASSKATRNKMNVPFFKNSPCNAKLEQAKSGSFDYWVCIQNQFGEPVRLPAKSHGIFNRALKDGWILSKLCEFKIINGNAYAVVFVQKEVTVTNRVRGVVGIDVGYKYSISDSNGYIGRKLSGVIKRSKEIQAQRRRNGHKISSKVKTTLKQILDIEAKRLIGRSDNMAFVVEDPKRLANLSSGKLHGWATSYFANRLGILCKENGIPLISVSPYQTSITCSKCQTIDKESRVSRDKFKCSACGFTLHADINASRNIALKGSQSIRMGKFCLSD